jgi:site-specific recombinase XerD
LRNTMRSCRFQPSLSTDHAATTSNSRHTCASYLAISGENLPTIQNVLNHSNLARIAIYARLNTKAIDRALQAQADRLGRLV